MRFTLVFTALLSLAAASLALADPQTPSTQPTQNGLMIVTYDISDLLRNTADYPLSSSSLPLFTDYAFDQPGSSKQPQGGGTPPNPGAAESGNPLTWDSLLALAKQMVLDQNSTATVLGDMLIVQGSPEVQQKMKSLLDSMHQQQGVASAMACTRVYWLSLSPAEVASIFDQVKPANGSAVAPMPQIPDAMIDDKHLYCQAQTICFSGQTVHVVSGRSTSYISSVTPVVGSNSVGYSPTVSSALSGVTVQLRPQLLSNGSAVVDVASMVNESADISKINVSNFGGVGPTTQPDQTANIETPNVVQQEFHTTVRLPLGKKILIGGMTLEPAAKDQAGRQLFLAIQVDAVQ